MSHDQSHDCGKFTGKGYFDVCHMTNHLTVGKMKRWISTGWKMMSHDQSHDREKSTRNRNFDGCHVTNHLTVGKCTETGF